MPAVAQYCECRTVAFTADYSDIRYNHFWTGPNGVRYWWYVADLGAACEVRGFRYLARQDGGWNGAFAETEFYVSNLLDTFAGSSAKATFKKLKVSQAADCKKPIRGRYVLVRILSEVNKGPWASAADIGIIGSK